MKCNEEAKKMKEGALFYRHATNFWKDFQQLSEHGVDRTALVKRIVAKTKKKEDFSFLAMDQNKHIAVTFFEAWEEMETKIKYADLQDNQFSIVWELQDLGKATKLLSSTIEMHLNLTCLFIQ